MDARSLNQFSPHSQNIPAEPGRGNGKNRLGWILLGVALFAALSLLASFLIIFGGREAADPGDEHAGILFSLPAPDEDDPFAAIEAASGEFPLALAGLLADSATISPGGGSPIGAMLPIFERAELSALVIAERGGGLSMYGALSLGAHPKGDAGLPLPDEWENYFLMPEIMSTDLPGVTELRAVNIASPLYFSAEEGVLYVADSLYDIVRINSLRDTSQMPLESASASSGRVDLVKVFRACPPDCSMGGHLRLSDGGIIAGTMSGFGSRGEEFRREPDKIVDLTVCWNTFSAEGRKLSDSRPSGEMVWSVSGLEAVLGGAYLSSLAGCDWSAGELFIPDPLIMSMGMNLPAPGRHIRSLPPPFGLVAAYMESMRLRQSDIASILTGPAVLSLGGRTQVLWYELPGIVADLPDRGDSGAKLVEKFWSDLFSGVNPKPLDDYPVGGATDFPFSLTAVGNGERTIIGLTSPGVEQNTHLKRLVAEEDNAIGWFYLDLPRLSSSVTDMPYMSELLSDEEGTPLEEESLDPVHKAMRSLGAVFVTWLSQSEGRAVWYK